MQTNKIFVNYNKRRVPALYTFHKLSFKLQKTEKNFAALNRKHLNIASVYIIMQV